MKPIEPKGDEEYVTLRMHFCRETSMRWSGEVDVSVHRDMLSCINAAWQDEESQMLVNKLAEALEKRVDWRWHEFLPSTVEAINVSTVVQNDHVFHCRYDDDKRKWYYRAAKKGKPKD